MPKLLSTFAVLSALLFAPLSAQAAEGPLVSMLKAGGYIIVMRHAHAPGGPPAPGAADPGNRAGERQLDAEGQGQAEAIGKGLKAAGVPVGPVYSSPTFRALQTVRLMGLKAPQARPELGDGGVSMAAGASGASGMAWLKAKAAEAPPKGTNVLIVTHGPNITLAFGQALKDLGDAEAAVFRPDGKGGAVIVGRLKPSDWTP